MKKVFKYPISLCEPYIKEIYAPQNFEPLCINIQQGTPFLWALVDPDTPQTTHYIRVSGTGHEIREDIAKYIDTFQMHGGSLFVHAFLLRKKPEADA